MFIAERIATGVNQSRHWIKMFGREIRSKTKFEVEPFVYTIDTLLMVRA